MKMTYYFKNCLFLRTREANICVCVLGINIYLPLSFELSSLCLFLAIQKIVNPFLLEKEDTGEIHLRTFLKITWASSLFHIYIGQPRERSLLLVALGFCWCFTRCDITGSSWRWTLCVCGYMWWAGEDSGPP